MRKKQFESHTSHNSLSSIPYRSNDFGPGTELALKQYSVFQEATHSMSFSTLSFIVGVATVMVQAMPFASVSSAAASVVFMPAMPPSPTPTQPRPTALLPAALVVFRLCPPLVILPATPFLQYDALFCQRFLELIFSTQNIPPLKH